MVNSLFSKSCSRELAARGLHVGVSNSRQTILANPFPFFAPSMQRQ